MVIWIGFHLYRKIADPSLIIFLNFVEEFECLLIRYIHYFVTTRNFISYCLVVKYYILCWGITFLSFVSFCSLGSLWWISHVIFWFLVLIYSAFYLDFSDLSLSPITKYNGHSRGNPSGDLIKKKLHVNDRAIHNISIRRNIWVCPTNRTCFP